jgi:hypothetical protein
VNKLVSESTQTNSVVTNTKHADYWRGQVWGRRSKLITDPTLVLALAVGSILTVTAPLLPVSGLLIPDLATAALTYSSIAFGACITALVLAVSLSPIERIKKWSMEALTGSEFSHYSDLVFVLTWSAIAQLTVIAFGLGAFFLGTGIPIVPDSPRPSHWLLLWASCVIFVYAFLQLLTVVSTLSQIAYVTIDELQKAQDASGAAQN